MPDLTPMQQHVVAQAREAASTPVEGTDAADWAYALGTAKASIRMLLEIIDGLTGGEA